MSGGPKGLRGHPLTSVRSVCASAAAMRPFPGTWALQHRRPGRVPTVQLTSLTCPAHPQPCLRAGRGRSFFPRISAPGPRARLWLGSCVRSRGQTQAQSIRPSREFRRKSRPTWDPSPAQSLARSYRLLPQSLLGNIASAAPPGTSKGALPGISPKDQRCPREGFWETKSSGSRGGARRLCFLNSHHPIYGSCLLQLRKMIGRVISYMPKS